MTAADSSIREVALEDFAAWRAEGPPGDAVHIKGFCSGIGTYYDEDAITFVAKGGFTLVVWDGDTLEETGFTRLLPQLLSSHPTLRVAAFRISSHLESFQKSWQKVAASFPGRFVVVPVELQAPDFAAVRKFFPDVTWAQIKEMPERRLNYVVLGSLAVQVTGAKNVMALGGGYVALKEAELLDGQGVLWIVFALSRNEKQEEFTTLMDWATKSTYAKLETGKDPHEAFAFADTALKPAPS
mmetsp:Transcript_51158/g.91931  ORF Transcript_51158/g.91931 Transcript_51158/m.91931 type:complete len:241 (+) Transcript_51158:44-766(+)